MKKNLSLEDRLEKWFEEKTFVACIITMIIVVCFAGLSVVVPIGLALTFHNAWCLLLYLPIVGFVLGINLYIEME